MKKWQSASVIAAVTMLGVCALCHPFTLRAQPHLTEAQAAALQPTPPGLISRSGNFWSLSCPTNPPLPISQ